MNADRLKVELNDASAKPPRSYIAFISYRHADNVREDRRWAEWLHQTLETYEIPRDLIGRPDGRGGEVPATLYPVFRDEVELPANAELSKPIRRALERSSHLIVLCSPRACESRFVDEEIRYFKELGKSDRILALILDGEPNADDVGKAASDIAPKQECFPDALRFGVPRESDGSIDWSVRTEPIAADVRPEGKPGEGFTTAAAYEHSLGAPAPSGDGQSARLSEREIEEKVKQYERRLELARLKIVAGLIGVSLGDLTQRDKAHQLEKERRRSRLFRRVAVGFVALAGIALAGAAIAWWQRNRAQTEFDRAEEARASQTEALAGAYYDRALALLEEDRFTEALPFTAAALRLLPQGPLASRLSATLLLDSRIRLPLSRPIEGDRYWSVNPMPDRNHAVIHWIDALPEWVDMQRGISSGRVQLAAPATSAFMSAFNERGEGVFRDSKSMQVWRAAELPHGAPERIVDLGTMQMDAGITGGGRHFVFTYPSGRVSQMVERTLGAKEAGGVLIVDRLGEGKRTVNVDDGSISGAAAIPGTDDFLTTGTDGKMRRWRAETGEQLAEFESDREMAVVTVSRDGLWGAAGGKNGRVTLVHLPSGTVQPIDEFSPYRDVHCLAFSRDSHRLAVGFKGRGDSNSGISGGSVQIWKTTTGAPLTRSIVFDDWVEKLDFDESDELLTYLLTEGETGVLDAATGSRLAEWRSGLSGDTLFFVSGGSNLAAGVDERSLRFYSAAPTTPAELKISLPGSVELLAISDDGTWAVVVIGSDRNRFAWISLREGRVIGPIQSHPGAAIGRLHVVPEEKDWAVILTCEKGGLRVIARDGTILRHQAPPPLLSDVLNDIETGNPVADSISVKFMGADDFAYVSSRHVLVEAEQKYETAFWRDFVQKIAEGTLDPDNLEHWQKSITKLGSTFTGAVKATDVSSGREIWSVSAPFPLGKPFLSQNGNTLLAMNTASGGLNAWRRKEGGEFEALHLPGDSVQAQDTTGGLRFQPHTAFVTSPDGRWAVGVGSKTFVFDLAAKPVTRRDFARGHTVESITFAPSGPIVALELNVDRYDGEVQLWNVETGRPVSPIFRHDNWINSIRFSPDSSLLFTASMDHRAQLWDVAKARPATAPFDLGDTVNVAEFLPDQSGLLVGGDDECLSLFPLPPASVAPTWVAPVLEALGGSRVDSDGQNHSVALGSVFDWIPAMETTAAETGFWAKIAEWLLHRSEDPEVPGINRPLSAVRMNHVLHDWHSDQRRLASAKLRETLQARPNTPVPAELASLAKSVTQSEPRNLNLDPPAAPKPGSVLEGPAGMRFRWVPAGRFLMGSPQPEIGRVHFESQVLITLTEGFWIGETEVTQAQWEAVMKIRALDHAVERLGDKTTRFNVSGRPAPVTCLEVHGISDAEILREWSGWFEPRCPMILVTATDADTFASRLTQLMAQEPVASLEGTWRATLPTEAQWEYACRAATTGPAWVGEIPILGENNAPAISSFAWYSGNSSVGIGKNGYISKDWPERESPGDRSGIHPVALKQPNPWGLHDMLGNVSEWCADGWDRHLQDGAVNPVYHGEDRRMIRGGSVRTSPSALAASARDHNQSDWRGLDIGFRVVLMRGQSDED